MQTVYLQYYKNKIQLRYCFLWLIYHTFYKGLKPCLIGFTVISNQLMTAVSAVDQCQHQQEKYFFFVSNEYEVNLISQSQLITVKALQTILYYEHNTL